MVEQEIKYKKLPGVKRKFIGKDRLWMGPDHLLLAESNGITENYKRFYFKDIQGINIIRTKRYLITNTILISAFLMVTFSGFYLWDGNNTPGAVFFGIISLVLFVYTVISLVQGASCECWLYTFVQKEKIKPLKSVKASTKAMTSIVPAIERAQGRLSSQSFENAGLNIKSAFKNKTLDISKSEKSISPVWHRILFSLLILLGVFITSTLYYHTTSYLIFGTFMFLCLLAVSAIVVAKQAGKSIGKPIKILSWVSLISLLVMMGIGYVEMLLFTIKNISSSEPFAMYNQFWLYEHYAKLNPFENKPILFINVAEVSVCLVLGILGFFLLYKEKE